MSCQDVTFLQGTCRIEVIEGRDVPKFTARMSLVDPGGQVIHPLVFADGKRAEIHATSEALARSTAVAYLESRFGPPSEIEHAFINRASPAVTGPPIVVEH